MLDTKYNTPDYLAKAATYENLVSIVRLPGNRTLYKPTEDEATSGHPTWCGEAFKPGDVFLWKDDEHPWVFNLATQEDYWQSRATYANMETVMTGMRTLAEKEGLERIAMPRIGAGYGGLSWKKCRAIVESGFDGRNETLYVYDDYVAED